MKRKRRLLRHGRGLTRARGDVDTNGEDSRANPAIWIFLSLALIAMGGFSLLLEKQTESVVRRFSSPAIQSASALRGAPRGQAVVLSGRIDPQTPISGWGLAIYDREHLDPPPVLWGRFGGRQSGPRTWGRRGGVHPEFTLVTDEGRVAILNRHYAIERPIWERGSGQDRHVGFKPEDEVLVIGKSEEGGVVAGKVFGGSRGQFRETLEHQQDLVPAERVLGRLLCGLGLVLACWVCFRIGSQIPGQRAVSETGLGTSTLPVDR